MSLAGYAPSLLSALDILVTPKDRSAYILQSQPLLPFSSLSPFLLREMQTDTNYKSS